MSRRVKVLAAAAGFDRCGITTAEPLNRAAYYRQWLAAGHSGEMRYLSENLAAREDPAQLLPGARSIVCVAINHKREEPAEPGSAPRAGEPTGRVAQYARGRDYHVVIRDLLKVLLARLRRETGAAFDARIFVDGAPLLERELARRAGIGWVGKNTLIVHERLGSYLFLGEALTTLELAADEPLPDHCGGCTRCLDACPTQAFPRPYEMDASRCISYLTIERRGELRDDESRMIGDWLFGCDICQEVCPFNGRAPLGTNVQLAEPRIPPRLPLAKLAQLTSGGHRRLTRGTAARRASLRMWRRNAAAVLQNEASTQPKC